MKFWKKPFVVQRPDGGQTKYVSFWQYVNHLRGKNFTIELPDTPQPDLDTLRSNVDANPTDENARMMLGAHLHTIGLIEEGYTHYMEAIALLSNSQSTDDDGRKLWQRAFTRRLAAQALEQMGREADAQEQWQECANDFRAATPDAKNLRENHLYLEAMAKL